MKGFEQTQWRVRQWWVFLPEVFMTPERNWKCTMESKTVMRLLTWFIYDIWKELIHYKWTLRRWWSFSSDIFTTHKRNCTSTRGNAIQDPHLVSTRLGMGTLEWREINEKQAVICCLLAFDSVSCTHLLNLSAFFPVQCRWSLRVS